MSKTNKQIKLLYEKYGNIRGKKLIEVIDRLDDTPYGPRYLKEYVESPAVSDLTPLTRRRLLKRDDLSDE